MLWVQRHVVFWGLGQLTSRFACAGVLRVLRLGHVPPGWVFRGGRSLLLSPVRVSAGSCGCCEPGWVMQVVEMRCRSVVCGTVCWDRDIGAVVGAGTQRASWQEVTSLSQHEGPLGNVPIGALCCAGHGPAPLLSLSWVP